MELLWKTSTDGALYEMEVGANQLTRYQEGTTTSMEWHNWMDHGGVNGRKGAG
jgi:hypothetical protein